MPALNDTIKRQRPDEYADKLRKDKKKQPVKPSEIFVIGQKKKSKK